MYMYTNVLNEPQIMISIYAYVPKTLRVHMCISPNVLTRTKKNNRISYYFSNTTTMPMSKVILYEDDFKNKYAIF